MLTDRKIENRIRKIQELQAQIKELEKQAEAVRAELKADLQERGLEEFTTGKGCTVRWKKMIQSSFDTKTFKTQYEEYYKRFLKKTECRRFEVKGA